METIDLEVLPRDVVGKGAARAMRRAGRIPGILYGASKPTASISMDAKEYERKIGILAGAHLIRLNSSAPELGGRLVLIRETQRHPVTRNPLHADLYEVDVNTKLLLRVPLHFIGKAAGVDMGGILQPIQREIEVRCLPTEIPEHIEVDVSSMGIHDVIHLSNLSAPPGVEIPAEGDAPVVTVLPPVVEEVKVAEAEVAEASATAAPAPEAAKVEGGKGGG